jgi:hypothetical protein
MDQSISQRIEIDALRLMYEPIVFEAREYTLNSEEDVRLARRHPLIDDRIRSLQCSLIFS